MPSFTQYRSEAGGFWADAPVLEIIHSPHRGWYVFDDFLLTDLSDVAEVYNVISLDTGAYAALTDEEGGVLQIDTGNTALSQILVVPAGGIAENSTAMPICEIKKDSNKRVWWECRVKRNQITSGSSLFGLVRVDDVTYTGVLDDASQTDTKIMDTSEPSFVGFLTAGQTSASGLDAVYMDSAHTGPHEIHKADVHTWVADTYVTLGLYFDGLQTVRYYVNGEQVGTDLDVDTTGFPEDDWLTAVMGGSTTTTTAIIHEVDWWRVCVSAERAD